MSFNLVSFSCAGCIHLWLRPVLVQLGVGRLESTVIKGSMPGTTNALITLAAFPDAVGKLRASGIRTLEGSRGS